MLGGGGGARAAAAACFVPCKVLLALVAIERLCARPHAAENPRRAADGGEPADALPAAGPRGEADGVVTWTMGPTCRW
jgi:hypothetical protein